MKLHSLALGAVASVALFAGGAFAADLPVRGPAPVPVFVAAPFNWSGFYVGANLGVGLSTTQVVDNDEYWTYGSANYDKLGVVGGAQIGYNYQFGNAVIGIEADFNGTSLKGAYNDADWATRIETKTPWFATIRGRAGLAVNNALFYGTAGVAIIKQNNMVCYPEDCTFGYYRTELNNNALGLAVGAGVEYAVSGNWTVKAEYLYMYAPEKKRPVTGGNYSYNNVSWQTSYNVVRLGLNYKFGR